MGCFHGKTKSNKSLPSAMQPAKVPHGRAESVILFIATDRTDTEASKAIADFSAASYGRLLTINKRENELQTKDLQVDTVLMNPDLLKAYGEFLRRLAKAASAVNSKMATEFQQLDAAEKESILNLKKVELEEFARIVKSLPASAIPPDLYWRKVTITLRNQLTDSELLYDEWLKYLHEQQTLYENCQAMLQRFEKHPPSDPQMSKVMSNARDRSAVQINEAPFTAKLEARIDAGKAAAAVLPHLDHIEAQAAEIENAMARAGK